MSSRELDKQCAILLGWTIRDAAWLQTHRIYEATADTRWTDDAAAVLGIPDGQANRIPYFSSDHGAVRLLEDWVEGHDLWAQYMTALFYILGGDDPDQWARDTHAHRAWLILRATPEQKARAFVEAVGRKEG